MNKSILIFFFSGFLIGDSFIHAKKKQTYRLDLIAKQENLVPVAIIGSGPAGYSAAITTSRAGMHTVIFEGAKPGGQLMGTTFVENWPGVPRATGPEIMASIEKQAKNFGSHFSTEIIEKISLKEWPFKLYTNTNTTISALTVIIATGTSPAKLDIPGEATYWGKGVMSCAVCDSPFTKNSRVVVFGGIDHISKHGMLTKDIVSAERIIEQVIQLAVYAKEITVVIPTYHIQLVDFLKRRFCAYPQVSLKYNTGIFEILGDEKKVTAVELFDTKKMSKQLIATDWIFLATEQKPATSLFEKQLDLSASKHIRIGCNTQETSIAGVFAGGNVSNERYRQASTASGDGVKAGLDALEFIRKTLQIDDPYLTRLKEKLYFPIDQKHFSHKNSQCARILTEREFSSKLQEKNNLLKIFLIHSSFCPDCKIILPLLLSFQEMYKDKIDIILINSLEAAELVKALGVFSLPTCLFYQGTKRLQDAHLPGSTTKKQMQKLIESRLIPI